MCLEFEFTYDVQISLRSVNPLSYYIYIYENYNRNYLAKINRKSKKSYEQNVLKIQFYICCTNFIRIGEQICDVT